MQQRPLGRSGLATAPLVFGGNVFGWTADEATSFRLLDAFVDAGFNLIDTADVYSAWVPDHSGGESETIIGRWLKLSGKRERVLIATKVGKEMGVNTWAAFYGADDHAFVDGDFATIDGELQPVLKALRKANINVVAIHSHMEGETPKVIFLHYWGVGPAAELAKGVKAALDAQKAVAAAAPKH